MLDPHQPQLRHDVVALFTKYQQFMDVELQQRAAEYLVRPGGLGHQVLHACMLGGNGLPCGTNANARKQALASLTLLLPNCYMPFHSLCNGYTLQRLSGKACST